MPPEGEPDEPLDIPGVPGGLLLALRLQPGNATHKIAASSVIPEILENDFMSSPFNVGRTQLPGRYDCQPRLPMPALIYDVQNACQHALLIVPGNAGEKTSVRKNYRFAVILAVCMLLPSRQSENA